MATKITYIRLPDGLGAIRGIGGNRNREFFLGTGCDNQWGGGVITSMELVEGSANLVRIRKDRPFIGPPDPSKGNKQEKFMSVVVSVAQYIPVEDGPEESSAGKPVQQPQVSSEGSIDTGNKNAAQVEQRDPAPAQPVQKQGQQQRR